MKLPGRIFFFAMDPNPRKHDKSPFDGVFSVDPNDGTWKRIIELGYSPRVSPDGRTLAYLGGSGGIWTCDTDGEGKPRKVSDLGVGNCICWSPDSRELIISGQPRLDKDDPGEEHATYQTWRSDADGRNRKRLPIPENEQVFEWSADGRWLLTAIHHGSELDLPSRTFSVFIRHADGKDPRRLTEDTRVITHRFAPDSRRVSYARSEGEAKAIEDHTAYGLWIVNIDGGNPRRVAQGREGHGPLSACWSPDGKWLAVTLREGKLGSPLFIDVMDTEGGNRRRIPLPHRDPIAVDWR